MYPTLTSPLHVELDLFQGPLHTLLQLIERHELPVSRVSLVAVTDQYLALVHASPTLDLNLTAEFLHVAARLLLLKSLAVLPRATEDEPREEDEEEDLEARLLVYRRFRDGARLLMDRQEQGLRMFGRSAPAETRTLAAVPSGIVAGSLDPRRLRRAARRMLARATERDVAVAAAPGPLISFAQVLQAVVGRLRGRERATFHDVAVDAGDTVTAITMFLVILELVRRQRLLMQQHGQFGPIILEHVTLEPATDGVGYSGGV
jgi:segregation and condensation protein A